MEPGHCPLTRCINILSFWSQKAAKEIFVGGQYLTNVMRIRFRRFHYKKCKTAYICSQLRKQGRIQDFAPEHTNRILTYSFCKTALKWKQNWTQRRPHFLKYVTNNLSQISQHGKPNCLESYLFLTLYGKLLFWIPGMVSILLLQEKRKN